MPVLANRYIQIWLTLMCMLAATIGGSFFFSGAVGIAFSLTIAFAKSGLIYWRFMHLHEISGFLRVVALAGAIWLCVLLTFVFTDYLTR